MECAEAHLAFLMEPGSSQDENGTDLSLLRSQLKLTVEERLLRLESQLEFAAELRRAMAVASKLDP